MMSNRKTALDSMRKRYLGVVGAIAASIAIVSAAQATGDATATQGAARILFPLTTFMTAATFVTLKLLAKWSRTTTELEPIAVTQESRKS